MRRLPLAMAFLAALVATAPGGEPPALPGRLALESGGRFRARLEVVVKSSFRSAEHRLRALDDEATIAGTFEATLGERRGDRTALEASFRELALRRTFHARISGFFSESERDGRGATAWREGEPDPPPPWRGLVSDRGLFLADAAAVGSEAARWPGEAWLDPRDRDSDDDAKLRRLARYTGLGTILGAPELPAPAARRFEARFPVVLGESGATNSFVDLEAVFGLEVEAADGGLVRVHGPLARVALVKGRGASERRVDRWLDVAFARGGPEASGELDAVFDPAKGRFRECRSRIALSHEGAFEGGRGRASVERRVTAREE